MKYAIVSVSKEGAQLGVRVKAYWCADGGGLSFAQSGAGGDGLLLSISNINTTTGEK